MDCVLDASLALAWVLPDEGSGKARDFFRSLERGDVLWVPGLWWYELANGLAMAARRGRVPIAGLEEAMAVLRRLPIKTDDELGFDAARRLAMIARERSLSAYDSAYLELAQRRGLPLASLDDALGAAAKSAGVAPAL